MRGCIPRPMCALPPGLIEDWLGKRERDTETQRVGVDGVPDVRYALLTSPKHPVGTTDVQMMSCRKGIGREGGATGAREDSGQAEPRCETGKRGIIGLWLSSIALQSHNYSQDVTQCSSDSFTLPSPDRPQHKNPIVLVVCSDNGCLWSSKIIESEEKKGLNGGESGGIPCSNLHC
ncbi:hypothetical protein KUCAC02_006584 [Chaenocephalus aceratus]|uniref:Uncharacterized protein n=1 Tax=Chaenocephalus aceratus TaxID=36190 RepID=A0ACB9VSV9_CHAAC|nr:hypothetical protein KUCAC02_006584 [Chaenocephalus aceratus]